MKNIKKLIKEILDKGYLMSLGTVDGGGVWVADVIYIYDDNFNIYWISQTSRRHSKAILFHPQVAGTITVKEKPGKEMGLQIEGLAKKIEGDILELAIKHRIKRGKVPPIKKGEVLDQDESWYKLTPTRIELIYGPLFGYNKQLLTF
ncbi:pyridoxamine 5'-phosphate oxidase family protein [Candidatus Daviesbacteria bacterium]|nr:pyridoxamine 5'-phosphate oxidase family protein [Candidatus Daviesbacteria bacterium]